MDEKVVWSTGRVIIENNKALICYEKKENLFCLQKYSRKK